ncbi:hypothetical protein HDU82_006189 [Entophlyctis luteolus]|nr:hypothetical protein HDU82_006189 [Entophlyctis luteolus]
MSPSDGDITTAVVAHIAQCHARVHSGRKPVVVGISGYPSAPARCAHSLALQTNSAFTRPQGAGKTTLVTNLVHILHRDHALVAVATSLDDLYLPQHALAELQQRNPHNPLLEFRGNPGTHDLGLGVNLLQEMIASSADPSCRLTFRIPKYDKSLHNGRGDRLPPERWSEVTAPIDIILFEGWCLGFRPLLDPDEIRAKTVNSKFANDIAKFSIADMLDVQKRLVEFEALYNFFEIFVHIRAEDLGHVYEWRQEQEDTMRENLRDPNAGLSASQVKDFVSRFMPQYLICLPSLTSDGFFQKPTGLQLQVVIDRNRQVIDQHVF